VHISSCAFSFVIEMTGHNKPNTSSAQFKLFIINYKDWIFNFNLHQNSQTNY